MSALNTSQRNKHMPSARTHENYATMNRVEVNCGERVVAYVCDLSHLCHSILLAHFFYKSPGTNYALIDALISDNVA